MKKLIITLAILFSCSTAHAACPGGICYVRSDGGTAAQCNGGSDAPVSNAPNCALKHPWYAYGWWTGGTEASPTGGQAGVMIGGDEVYIAPKAGGYQAGNDSHTTGYFSNCGSATTACKARPIPSGTFENPTKVFGCSSTGCAGAKSTYPEIWSSGRSEHNISLKSSEYVEVGWLNITDHATCGYNHGWYGCGSAEIDQLSGKYGILLRYSSNITLRNLWVHGFYSYGLYGGNVTNLTVIDSNIDLNSFGGYSQDSCGSSACSNNGTFNFSGTTPVTSSSADCSINWNGCVEDANNPGNPATGGCYSQSVGGYGDGVGANSTSGAWSFTQCDVSHNTSDGIDMLYLNKDGMTGGTLTVKRSRMEGNLGNQLKGPNQSTIEDNLIIGNCGFFVGQSFSYPGIDICRAGGHPLIFAWRNEDATTPIIYSNTILGNDSEVFGWSGTEWGPCTSGSDVLIKNNLIVGGRDRTGTSDNIGFWYNDNASSGRFQHCYPELILDHNVCVGGFDSHGDCTTTNGFGAYYQTATANNVHVDTFSDVFTGNIYQGPSTWYTDADYMDQLFIKNTSDAYQYASKSFGDDKDVNNFDRDTTDNTWDAGGLDYGTEGQSGGAADCTAQTISNCDLDLTSSGSSDGTCSAGYDGTCEYSCTDGLWSLTSNACIIAAATCGNNDIETGEDCDYSDDTPATSGYWKLNDDAATSAVIETMGAYTCELRADNTLVNTADYNTTGNINGALDWGDGTSKLQVECGDVLDKAWTDSWSVEAWFKSTDTSAEKTLVSKLDPNDSYKGWLFYIDGTGLAFFFNASTYIYTGKDITAYLDGNWHQAVMTYSGGGNADDVIFYIDNTKMTNSTSGTNITSSPNESNELSIGIRNGSGGTNENPFIGSLDNVRIFNRVITDAEVSELYNSGSATEAESFTASYNLNGQTCESQGYSSGDLGCDEYCAFDYSGCGGATCGNGVLDSGEQCDPPPGNTTNGDGCSEICEDENVNYQHFLADYTETDASSHIVVTTHKVALTGLTHNESAKVERDFGAGYFQNYIIKGHYTMDSCTSTAWEDCGIGVISLTETSRADLAAQEAALDGISLTFAATSNFASKTWKLVIAGVLADSAADSHPFIQRYIKMTVNGTAVTVEFYEDANYTTEIAALELTGTYNGGYPRYLVVGSSYNSANADVSFSGSIQDVNLSTETPPDPPAQGCTGTTTDYCIIPTLADAASGGACSNTGSCEYLCTNGVLSETSNTCTVPAPTTKSITVTGQNLTVTFQ